jgi:uncharacterized repeat protein (TIGR03803 family)
MIRPGEPGSMRTRWITAAGVLALGVGLSACGSGNGGAATSGHTLSATVTGLTDSGLVLTTGQSQVSVASGATAVVLATRLASGAAYDVSVVSQPTGEACSVAGGSGVIGTADVANVVVTCSAQAYPLGGSVSGLSSSGLVLANGGDTLAVAAGAAGFTLPSEVARGSSYAVTVQAQPVGLACSVSNGAGTMPASAVTTVQVTCTDQPFSLGGARSGLGNETGLVLANGSDMLTVSAGATAFTLPQPVPYGQTYDVTVASAPAGKVCSVFNGAGTMPAANVTDVVVTCSDSAYTLGGSVSGLGAAGGLVLANGADSLSVSPGAASFTMPGAVSFGSPYLVTVQSQPVGETCSTANAAGTMPAANVTTVAVTCSASTYSIGGTISGLTASGLKLLNNGTDATQIAANAAQFTMNTGVAYGGSYDITVETPPAGEVCRIANATGTPVTGNVTGVTLTCNPWSAFSTSALHSFDGANEGVSPQGGVIQGSDGSLYGTTTGGGSGNLGTIFKITPSGTLTVLHAFGGSSDGGVPYGALVQGTDGNFYGTTTTGGSGNLGTIFEITPSGTFTVLHYFTGTSDGGVPYGALVQGSDGKFYGTTTAGGTYNGGTIFAISAAGSFQVIHHLNGSTDGVSPYGALVQGTDGNFYGTTTGGGAGNLGTVFKVTPAGTFTVLHAFGGSSDGGVPDGGLVQASDGNFYGTTTTGGANNGGTIFLMTPAGGFLVLHDFSGSVDGVSPYGTMIQATDGNLYGTTTGGGTGNLGTIFQITPSGTFTVLHAFGGSSDGGVPDGALVQASDGNFYGTTTTGGANNGGTIYEMIPQ